MAQLKNTTINDSEFIRVPSGTTAQRPASPQPGMIRYNTTIQRTEFYNGTRWVNLDHPLQATTTGTVVTQNFKNYTVHAFNGSGTITFLEPTIIDCIIVAGGGSGSNDNGAGGAGGVVLVRGFPVDVQSYTITVGSGGAAPAAGARRLGINGQNSTAFGYTASGGGGGGSPSSPNATAFNDNCRKGLDGGSGGGAGRRSLQACTDNNFNQTRGESTQNQYISDQYAIGYGHPGVNQGPTSNFNNGGAGGAGSEPSQGFGTGASAQPGNGGIGMYFGDMFGDNFGDNGWFAGGGGGTADNSATTGLIGLGGRGGGGNGGTQAGQAGQTNTGGGGGAGRQDNGPGGAGGSGIVIIRYLR